MIELFLIIGAIIFLGFLSTKLFERTGISEILLLMLAGYALGPLTGLINASPGSILFGLAGFMGTLALILLLFEGGLFFDVGNILGSLTESFAFTILGFALSVAAIAAVMHFVFHWEALASILVGATLSGTSAVSLFGAVSKIGAEGNRVKAIIWIESTLTDAFSLILAFLILDIMTNGPASFASAPSTVAAALAVAIVMGIAAGIAWSFLIEKFQKLKFSYMLTIATVFVSYAVADYLGGNGGLAVFTFGTVLGNSEKITRTPSIGANPVRHNIRHIHEEIAFFVRTFFFVYLGLLLEFSGITIPVLLGAVAIITTLLLVRYAAARVTVKNTTKSETWLLTTLVSSDLAEAVLAGMPAARGIYIPGFFETIMLVIVFTNVLSTFGIFLHRRMYAKGEGNGKENGAEIEAEA